VRDNYEENIYKKKKKEKTFNFHIFDYHSLPQLIVCPQTIYQEKMGRKIEKELIFNMT
jgi:hypothetical protein